LGFDVYEYPEVISDAISFCEYETVRRSLLLVLMCAMPIK